MKRTVLVAVAAVVALVTASGTALAEAVTCDPNPPCYGTPEADGIDSSETLSFPPTGETVHALGGNDGVRPLGGDDTVYGGPGNDTVEGSAGSDAVYGGAGKDTIYADLGDSAGSKDRSSGGDNNDTITADDGNVDVINCGRGKADTVHYDVGTDTIKNCEIKNP